jgi:hypothetical protein
MVVVQMIIYTYCCPLSYPVCCGNQSGCCPAGYRCAGKYCIPLVRSLGDESKVVAVAAIGRTAKLEQSNNHDTFFNILFFMLIKNKLSTNIYFK